MTCAIEGSKPLEFTVTGLCSTSSEAAEIVPFSCAVRETATRSIWLTNPTNNPWIVRPVFSGSEWSGEECFEIPSQGKIDYVIKYHPLTRTKGSDMHKVMREIEKVGA